MIGRVNSGAGGGGGSGIPEFTYTGTYEVLAENNKDWKIRFLTSGTLTFTKLKGASKGIDVFLVGGGGAGTRGANGSFEGSGGGGGYTLTVANISVVQNATYSIVIGAGATASTGNTQPDGGFSSAFNQTANGGKSGYVSDGSWGGDGGSGGAGWYYADTSTNTRGVDGGNGGTVHGGTGQGTSTREFWGIDHDSNADLYSYGGYNSSNIVGGVPAAGQANTGDGGQGGKSNSNQKGADGGSGIVIIRNKRG